MANFIGTNNDDLTFLSGFTDYTGANGNDLFH